MHFARNTYSSNNDQVVSRRKAFPADGLVRLFWSHSRSGTSLDRTLAWRFSWNLPGWDCKFHTPIAVVASKCDSGSGVSRQCHVFHNRTSLGLDFERPHCGCSRSSESQEQDHSSDGGYNHGPGGHFYRSLGFIQLSKGASCLFVWKLWSITTT
jgi:hypothetical protein